MVPVSRDGYKFRQDVCIPCYQTDSQMVLKPAAFMDLAQEIAYWAAEELGFGYDSLHVHHTAWVLSRLHIHFNRAPRWREEVSLFTWHKKADGLFYLRDFELKDTGGKSLVKATSSWVVIDEQTRRLVRPEVLQERMKTEPETEDAIAEPAPKVVMPKGDARSVPGMTEAEAVGKHIVSYADTDMIGHTNNARYVVWAMDCLPPEVTARAVKDLCINFNRETKPGDIVELRRTSQENTWYVEGCVDGKSCFTVKMEF
ncbi:MAG: hypothetical protein IK008_00365 [Bacteroidales bacterium]|nr:hypothetical protein [Bacteroidales bacterium]